MALFTDGPVSQVEDLAAQDSQILDVSSEEGINLTQKLILAQEAIGLELESMLGALHFADRLAWVTHSPRLNQIVVTAPLKLWHTYRCLELAYADAFGSQLNDRYATKRAQFHESAAWARNQLVQSGLGIAASPVPRAAAPTITTQPGALADGTYYVTMAWVSGRGEEGSCALPIGVTVSSATFAVQPASAPAGISGWNVFAGSSLDGLIRQNPTVVGVSQEWVQPGELVIVGSTPSHGQKPTYFQPIPSVLRRG